MLQKFFSRLHVRGFRHLLLKYMATIMIPAFILVCAVTVLLHENLASSQNRKIQNIVETAQDSVTYTLDMVNSICVSIDKSRSVISSLLPINEFSRVNAYNLVGNYAILDAMYANMSVFFPQTPSLLYSSSGTQSLGLLSEYGFWDSELFPEDQLRLLTEPKLYSNLAATDESPVSASQLLHNHSYLYVCASGSLSNTSGVSIFLQISTSTFYNAYQSIFQHYDSHDYAMFTLDASGQVIGMAGALVDRGEMISPQWVESLADRDDVLCFPSEHPNFTNYFLLNRSVVTAPLGEQMRATYCIMGIVLLIALTAVVLLANQVYRPIALLHDNFLAGIREMPLDRTELQSIDRAIADIILSYNRREEQSRHILDMMKRQLVYWALLNSLPRTEHMEQMLKLTGFDQPNMLFCVFAIELPADTPQSLVDELCRSIQQMDWNNSDVTAVWISNQDILSVVFHMFVELDSRTRQEYSANALRMILEQYSISSGIGIGISQPTLFTLSRSYTTAQRALSGDSVPYRLFEDLQDEGGDRFSECLRRLIASINDGQPQSAQSELDQYIQYLNELAPNRSLVMFYTARLLNDISAPLVDMGIWAVSQLDSEIERLMFLDLRQLSDALHALLQQMGANSAHSHPGSKADAADPILRSIHEYLVENALDPMLNINLVAEKFGASVVTLNRRFRQQYGSTMVNLVSGLRIERAKELLRTSDMRIKDIVTAVGYFDVPNFSRKFKAAVGETPGQYRRRERDGVEAADSAEDEE